MPNIIFLAKIGFITLSIYCFIGKPHHFFCFKMNFFLRKIKLDVFDWKRLKNSS